jgi:hypothetical protein
VCWLLLLLRAVCGHAHCCERCLCEQVQAAVCCGPVQLEVQGIQQHAFHSQQVSSAKAVRSNSHQLLHRGSVHLQGRLVQQEQEMVQQKAAEAVRNYATMRQQQGELLYACMDVQHKL